MSIKKISAFAASVVMCISFAACGSASDSSSVKDSSVAESSSAADSSESSAEENESDNAEESSAVEVGTTDYDVNGDFRAFDDVKKNYGDGYSIDFSMDNVNYTVDFSITISGDKVYMSTVMAGMKSYSVMPGDGKIYTVSEATTTYSETDAQENFVATSDFLFGATGDFSKAEIDAETNTVYEYYKLNTEVSGSEGEIAYGFDGESYQLKEIQIYYAGSENPKVYAVKSLTEAKEELLEKPDLSAYTKE